MKKKNNRPIKKVRKNELKKVKGGMTPAGKGQREFITPENPSPVGQRAGNRKPLA